jgi:hypothetical protein
MVPAAKSGQFPTVLKLVLATAGLMIDLRATSAQESAPTAVAERPITAAERDHWAYRPLVDVEIPTLSEGRWNAHPVDRFLKFAMYARSVEPMPRAGKLVLMRRAFVDLTGLLPTPREVREFLDDPSPDAYEALIDRLLASPAYGERWAQHWLDLARYAETDGFEHDLVRPNAWRYRDWVIEALNRDLPFDEFVRLQVAGDLLRPGDADAAIATGFLLCGPDMPDLNLQVERRHVVLNEITSTVGSVFLAMQFGCAACHDHKFDPIRQHDFYRLRAFFEPADVFRDHPVPTAEQLAERRAAEAAVDPIHREHEARRRELEELGRHRFRDKNPDVQPPLKQLLAELSDGERQEHAGLVKELKSAPRLRELPLGRVMRESDPRPANLYLRGDFRQPGPTVECGFPRVISEGTDEEPPALDPPRARLAEWLTNSKNPLTARVIVNRLWQWHFGSALSANASDFGLMGAEPTHPQLLDWLARRFMSDGWSLKRMHRLLMTSEAYRTASTPFDHAWSDEEATEARDIWKRSQAIDPTNSLGWHRRRMRLDGETIRDCMLVAGDQLSPRRGGPGIRPPLPPEVTVTLLKDQWVVSGDDEDHRRRGNYLFVRRNLRYPMFDVFDRPDTNASCAVRHESTTAPQSLALLNSEFSLRAARWLAGAVLRLHAPDPAAQIEAAYLRAFSRSATPDEVRAGQDFLDSQARLLRASGRGEKDLALPEGVEAADPPAAAALVDFCLALFNANEFVYLD